MKNENIIDIHRSEHIESMTRKLPDTYSKAIQALVDYRNKNSFTLDELSKQTELGKDTIQSFISGKNVGGTFLTSLIEKIPQVGSSMAMNIKTYTNYPMLGNINFDGSVSPINFNDPLNIDLPSYYQKYSRIFVYKYQSSLINKFFTNYLVIFTEIKDHKRGIIPEDLYNQICLLITEDDIGALRRYFGFLSVSIDTKKNTKKFVIINANDGQKIKYEGSIIYSYPLLDIKSPIGLNFYKGVK